MRPDHPIKALVIEDSASDVFLLERMLDSGAGARVEITSVPRLIDAFRQIDDEHFDIILLDLNLLDMNGVASVAALAAEAPDTPIIVHSGMENRRLQEEALLCGAYDYLVKGQDSGPSLHNAIAGAMARRGQAANAMGR